MMKVMWLMIAIIVGWLNDCNSWGNRVEKEKKEEKFEIY